MTFSSLSLKTICFFVEFQAHKTDCVVGERKILMFIDDEESSMVSLPQELQYLY